MKNTTTKFRAFAATTIVASLWLSACGSDDNSSATDDNTASTVAGDGGDSTDTAVEETAESSGSECFTVASERAEAGKSEVPVKLPPEPLDLAAIEGASLWLIQVVDNPLINAVADGYTAGAEEAGMTVTVYDAQGAVDRMNEGVAQAVAQGADVIALLAVPEALVAQELAIAVDAGVKIIDNFNGLPDDPLSEGFFAHVTFNSVESGARIVDWILADSECDANLGLFYSANNPAALGLREGAQSELTDLCPDCGYEEVDFDLAKNATDLGPAVQSLLTAHPETNYVFIFNDSSVTFVDAALAQTGRDGVKIVSHDGVAENLDAMRAETTAQALTVAFPPSAWIGWAMADASARAIAGQEMPDWTIPTRLVDSTNIGASNDELWAEFEGFEQSFVDIWTGT